MSSVEIRWYTDLSDEKVFDLLLLRRRDPEVVLLSMHLLPHFLELGSPEGSQNVLYKNVCFLSLPLIGKNRMRQSRCWSILITLRVLSRNGNHGRITGCAKRYIRKSAIDWWWRWDCRVKIKLLCLLRHISGGWWWKLMNRMWWYVAER